MLQQSSDKLVHGEDDICLGGKNRASMLFKCRWVHLAVEDLVDVGENLAIWIACDICLLWVSYHRHIDNVVSIQYSIESAQRIETAKQQGRVSHHQDLEDRGQWQRGWPSCAPMQTCSTRRLQL